MLDVVAEMVELGWSRRMPWFGPRSRKGWREAWRGGSGWQGGSCRGSGQGLGRGWQGGWWGGSCPGSGQGLGRSWQGGRWGGSFPGSGQGPGRGWLGGWSCPGSEQGLVTKGLGVAAIGWDVGHPPALAMALGWARAGHQESDGNNVWKRLHRGPPADHVPRVCLAEDRQTRSHGAGWSWP